MGLNVLTAEQKDPRQPRKPAGIALITYDLNAQGEVQENVQAFVVDGVKLYPDLCGYMGLLGGQTFEDMSAIISHLDLKLFELMENNDYQVSLMVE